MQTYLIGYDLNRPHQDYQDLINTIKTYSNWWHYLDSTWIIKTNDTVVEVRDNLRQHVDSNDELLVMEHRGAAAWTGFDDKASDWLKTNL